MRVAVVGAHGQLGAAIVHEFGRAHDVEPFTRAKLDVTDDRAVDAAIAATRPDLVVNCAAYNDVDRAEDRPIEALDVNAFAVRALARAASACGAILVHYSSDFVFDGRASAPYTEDARPGPRSTYAASKLLGEWFAADAPRWYVLRVESLFGRAPYGPPPKGTVATLMRKLLAGEEARVIVDRTVSPTQILDAARATVLLVERRLDSGIYHCVNSGRCTWYELAQELARQLEVEPRLVPVRMAEMHLRAQRPLYCALSNEKLRAAGITMPTWEEGLRKFLATERNRSSV